MAYDLVEASTFWFRWFPNPLLLVIVSGSSYAVLRLLVSFWKNAPEWLSSKALRFAWFAPLAYYASQISFAVFCVAAYALAEPTCEDGRVDRIAGKVSRQSFVLEVRGVTFSRYGQSSIVGFLGVPNNEADSWVGKRARVCHYGGIIMSIGAPGRS